LDSVGASDASGSLHLLPLLSTQLSQNKPLTKKSTAIRSFGTRLAFVQGVKTRLLGGAASQHRITVHKERRQTTLAANIKEEI